MITWNSLTEEKQIEELIEASHHQPIMIFKHSTRCSISSTALSRLERKWSGDKMVKIKPFYLDLITYRTISNALAEQFGVQHESPQVLLVKQGTCVYHASHMAINVELIAEHAN